jgi:hypothetical protein
MSKFNLSDLVQGVEPDPHEFNVFVIDRHYRVDLMMFSFNGSCTCDDFCRLDMAGKLERGIKPSWRTECKHIQRVKMFYCYRALAFDKKAYEEAIKICQPNR